MKRYVLLLLLCGQAYAGDALVCWQNATERTDGSPFTDLATTRVYVNNCGPTFSKYYNVVGSETCAQLVGIAPGTHCFAAQHVDSAGVTSALSNIVSKIVEGVDADNDSVSDDQDNCTLKANPDQVDSDSDGFGNACDGDLNNNGLTNAFDTPLFRAQLGQPSVAPYYNAADIDANGSVNSFDIPLFRALLGLPPGPSGLIGVP